MVGKTNYSSVPTAVELENHGNKKYTVNRKPDGLVISKPLCTLMAIGTLLLAVLVGLIVFFLVPRCTQASQNASFRSEDSNRYEVSGDSLLNLDKPPGAILNLNKPPVAILIKEVDERLPRSIEPTHYRIQIIPHLDNLTTNGIVTMTLNIKEETKDVIFHVKDVEIDKASVAIKSAKSDKPLSITSQDYIEGERYRIVLDERLTKNIMYTLELKFVGHLNKHLQGFYLSKYEEHEKSELIKYSLASTQFSPTDARRAFPCFDEPSFKANFTIVIARPTSMSSLSNMPLQKQDIDAVDGNLTWDYYETTPKMSTYLVAFVVSDLQGYGSSDKVIKMWARRPFISETTYAAELAPKMLRFFENYFNIPFPLPKIDIVAIPDFGYNAMENWGLITFRESALLYDKEDSDVDNKRSIATILAHELGHQWFGNLVTPKWWNDLWLKEGFATYLQYLGTQVAEPSWHIDEEFIISETDRAFELDALESSRAISFDVKNNRQIRQTFDELSYGKGACVIRMMNHFLGEETFKSGLIKFLEEYKYGNADREDLFRVLTEEAVRSGVLDESMTIKTVMDSWTKQPGFPVVTAIADKANKKLILSQRRFLYGGQHNDSATWWVPISVTTDLDESYGDTKPAVWLKNEPMMTVNLNFSQWYIININKTGYFIVNYDENNWRKLTENIMNLPPLTRAQLISDSMDLARANLLDYDIPLKLIARMAIRDGSIMFIPTSLAFKKLEYLSDILANTPVFGLFEEYQSVIFKRTYQNVNSDTNYYSDNYLLQKIRKAVMKWSCRKIDSECAIKSHHNFRFWMEKNQRVPPNLREIVYCTAIRQGSEAEWTFAYNQYLRTNSVSEKNVLLDALGCTTRRWLLSRYLDLLVRNDSSIRIQDAGRVFKSVSDNNVASTMAFDFLRTNWDKLLAHYGEGFNIISKMVKNLPRYMNNEYQLAELIRFRNEVRNNIGTASQAFDSAIEKVRGNVAWMKKNYHSVEKWFIDHKSYYNLL